MPERVFFVGHAGSGKTRLLEELVKGLRTRGRRVGCLKHSPHVHELDKPGKDSHRHRVAGAEPSGVISQGLSAIFISQGSEAGESTFERLAPLFDDCDFLLVEGHKQAEGRKLEVYRAAAGEAPLAADDDGFWAVITDDALELVAPIWPRSDLESLMDRLEALLA